MLKPSDDPIYQRHLCDMGKFQTIVSDRDKPRLDDGWMDKVKEKVSKGGADVLISSDATIEEAEKLMDLAEKSGGNAVIDRVHESTVDLDELLNAKKIFVEEGVYDTNPIMKMFVDRAKRNGAEEVLSPEDVGEGVLVVNERSDITADRMIVAYSGANSRGLVEKGLTNEFSDA